MRAALLTLALLAPPARGGTQEPGPEFDAAFASITEKDLLVHVTELASPQLEGRDSPSEGLHRAGEYVIGRLKAAGVEPGAPGTPGDSYRMGYTLKREAPVATDCLLAMTPRDGEEVAFTFDEDFVPLPDCNGEGEGTLAFYGFGITESGERYDDLKGKNCNGEIVLILESEPRSKKLFEGPVVTKAGDVYVKAKALEDRGARGILVVRRPPAEQPKGLDGKPVEQTGIGFRHTWAHWEGGRQNSAGAAMVHIPVLEISLAAASRLLGEDVGALAEKIDASGKPIKKERKDLKVTVRAKTEERPVPIDNIVGLVRGSDPALATEYVLLGAHYDHIGVDPWGRIGCGADDNGSGSSALIEIAEAMVLAKPKRSIVFVWFSAEEDGLIGSEEYSDRPSVPLGSIVTMINMDMLGRCDEYEVCVLGTGENPHLDDVVKDAKKLRSTGLKKVVTGKGQEFWERSDQFNFHKHGIPALFFFEGAIEADNPDYHTYDDTVDKLSVPKMARITRLIFNTAWLVANAPKRPPPPR